ncbi:MAG TPA: radical SAM protein [Thermoleophilia bacterium]|nr:radical SAM protein [Thermoleophilia bacterium]
MRPPSRTGRPSYVALSESGELGRRAQRAAGLLAACELCPRRCGVDRTTGAGGVCGIGARARVASYGPHHGEESVLRGRAGSGTVFFGGCNLRCRFCQNSEISHRPAGEELAPAQLAAVFLDVQDMGCHNLNLVTPSHVVAQILAALAIAVPQGLRIPIVYNTGGYDAVETLALLDGVVDIYMPDVKLLDAEPAERYLTARDYPEVVRRAMTEMQRQVGDLVMGADGLAVRGLLVRHLVMPGLVAESEQVFAFLAGLSPDTFVNVMDQYRPCAEASLATADVDRGQRDGRQRLAEAAPRRDGGRVHREDAAPARDAGNTAARNDQTDVVSDGRDRVADLRSIARRITRAEFGAALDAARAAGLRRAARSP